MPAKIVNVSAVQHRSPLRYPGGKTWLVPRWREFVAEMTEHLGRRPARLVEPFAGGAIVGLTSLAERLVDSLTLVELDPAVAAVWRQIVAGDSGALARRILDFKCTRENVIAELAERPRGTLALAWQTVLRNRTSRGGILAPGASLIKSGENGKGISSRWYPETLARRISEIANMRNDIEFIEGNAFDVIAARHGERDALWFVDPPYTLGEKSAGSRLYLHSELDHEKLLAELADVSGGVMITYPRAAAVERMAARFRFDVRYTRMKNAHHREQDELLLVKAPAA